jgi:hypothetical protein
LLPCPLASEEDRDGRGSENPHWATGGTDDAELATRGIYEHQKWPKKAGL